MFWSHSILSYLILPLKNCLPLIIISIPSVSIFLFKTWQKYCQLHRIVRIHNKKYKQLSDPNKWKVNWINLSYEGIRLPELKGVLSCYRWWQTRTRCWYKVPKLLAERLDSCWKKATWPRPKNIFITEI